MRTVRRLYFYAVAAISIEVVLWGLINLLRSIADQTVGGGVDALAQAIALVVVGVPIFLFHWLWAQRNAAKDEEEKTSTVRALYLYGVLLGTLVPLVQNLLALLDRTFLDALHLGADNALVGGSQSWPDNLIAIGMNALVAAYFFNILRNEWKTLPRVENFADIRRLFRFIWLYYSLVMMVLGAQQILSFMLSVPPDVLGDSGRAQLINGIALMVVGTPTWFYSWSLIQRSLADAAEKDSNLRLGVLYLLALGSVITVLSMAVALLGIFISQLLGLQLTYPDLVHQIAGPVSIGLPLGVVWAYYGKVLNEHFASTPDPVRRSGMQRVQFYILSALGLGGAFLGVAALIKFMIDLLTGGTLILTDALRSNLAGTIALILAWLPLWLVSWRPMQREALGTDELGLHARRSVVRKAYLYLALFAGVIGGMGSAVALVFSLLRALLTGQTDSTFLATNLTDLELLILFVVLLAYHLRVLRRDGAFTSDSLAKNKSDFKVLIVDSGEGFTHGVQSALAKTAPNVSVTVASDKPAGAFNAIVMSGSSALQGADWTRVMDTRRIVIPDENGQIVWAGGIPRQGFQQAAQAIRQLAEGQEVANQSAGRSGWMIVVYIAAAMFGFQFLLLLVVIISAAFLH